MKVSVEWIVDSILFTFFVLIVFGMLNMTSQINHAYNYHHSAVAAIEESHFEPSLMNALKENGQYKLSFHDQSIQHDLELYPKENLYQIETTYELKIPIIGYKTECKIVSYAR